jgi:V/A-type H+-transporting ATPase subunit E
MNDKPESAKVSSGVQALIQQLRKEGVEKGRSEAARIVEEAQSRAEWILRQAQDEADQILHSARKEAEKLRRSGEEALSVAARDAVLSLKSQLSSRFAGEVRRLVGEQMKRAEILEKLILEVAGRVGEEAAGGRRMEVLLPTSVIGLEELSRKPEELEKGILTHFVTLISRDMLREGVSLGMGEDGQGGLRLRLEEEGIILDMTDRAVAEVLLEHLQPRFRALLEGIVR